VRQGRRPGTTLSSCIDYRDLTYTRLARKTMVAKPQITTPASKIDHSDGLSAQTLPSDTT
jgi:hypothetical protein